MTLLSIILTTFSLFATITSMKRLLIDDLIAWKNTPERKPLIIQGVRQVGKTYLLQNFGKTDFPKVHYFDFEKMRNLHKAFDSDLNPQRIINELSFYLDNEINISNDLVIFDEIQACPNALTSLKYFCEEMPALALCCAGSLIGIHLTPTSYPVGKVSTLKLNPMSFQEFLMAQKDNRSLEVLKNINPKSTIPEIVHEHLWKQLKIYFIVGGLPEAVLTFCQSSESMFTTFLKVRKKQTELASSYYADMTKHSGKVNAMHIDRVFKSVPAQLYKTQDNTTSRFRFRGVVPGVSHYQRLAGAIDWLEAAGLVIKVYITNTGHLPFKAYSKENKFKLLLFDIGLLGCMANLSPKTIMDYDYGSYKGYFAENFVAQEFLAYGESALYCWSEKASEVEFLREIDGKAVPFEVKSGKVTQAKSLKVFSEKYSPPYQVILSARPLSIIEHSNTHKYPLYMLGQISNLSDTNSH